jgi:hypothetical protein
MPPPRATAPSWPGPHYRGFAVTLRHTHTHTHTHSHTHTQSVGLLRTSDQPDAETSTWQYTTLTTDRHPWPQRDSYPQQQQASSRRPILRPRVHRDRQAKPKYSVKKELPLHHFMHHKFHIDLPGIEPELPQRCRQLTAWTIVRAN